MKFYIENEGDSLLEFNTLEEFLEEIRLQVEDCQTNGGTEYIAAIRADAYCFNPALLED
jgi:hypothetical protein